MLDDQAPDVLTGAAADDDLALVARDVRALRVQDVAEAPDVRARDLHAAVAVAAGHDLAQRALGDRLPAVDDDDIVRGLADLGEHVAGDEHRAALARQL